MIMSEPVVTTLIPTYRRPALLARAIRSAQAQTYPDIRIAVFDNASGDETGDVVRTLAAADPRITYHRHDTNLGLLGNYNFAMRHAATPYFSFLADDDILSPRFYEEALQGLEANPDAWFFAARTLIDNQVVGVRQLAGRSWRSGRYEPGVETVLHMIAEHFIGTSCLFRTRIVDSIGVFEPCASDRNYVIVAAAKHPFIAAESIAVQFTIHRGSVSGGAVRDEEAPIALDATYVLALHEELDARLAAEGVLSGEDGARIRRAVWRKYRADVWWAVLTKSFPARRTRDLARFAAERKRYRFSAAEAMLLRLLTLVTRARPVHRAAAWMLARAHRLLLLRQQRDVPPLSEAAA